MKGGIFIDQETSIARLLRIHEANILCDAAICQILANKYILASLMKYCIPEYTNYSVTEIAEDFIESSPQFSQVPVLPDETNASMIRGAQTVDKSVTEGTMTFDVKFYARIPGSDDRSELIIDIEAQNDFTPGYPIVSRGIFYNSRIISSQYNVEFKHSHYEKIKKTYSIWICTHPTDDMANSINMYKISESHLVGNSCLPVKDYDLSTVVLICLSNKQSQKATGLIKLLDVLFANDMPFELKKNILENEFHIKMSEKLEGSLLNMCNISKGIFEDGVSVGEENATILLIKSLKETTDWFIAQVMKMLKIPLEQQEFYAKMIDSS